jgi:hypothetical protein
MFACSDALEAIGLTADAYTPAVASSRAIMLQRPKESLHRLACLLECQSPRKLSLHQKVFHSGQVTTATVGGR